MFLVDEQIVERVVCGNVYNTSEGCDWFGTALVKNCNDFYVYKLPNPVGCDMAYCVDANTHKQCKPGHIWSDTYLYCYGMLSRAATLTGVLEIAKPESNKLSHIKRIKIVLHKILLSINDEQLTNHFVLENGTSPTPPPTPATVTSTPKPPSTTYTGIKTTPPLGVWGPWSEWGSCSQTCDNGKRTRTRICMHPPCNGSNSETEVCSTNLCEGRTIFFIALLWTDR